MYHITINKGKLDSRNQEIISQLDGEFIIKKKGEKRTTDQNDGLWRWDNLLADFTGEDTKKMHYLMCGEIFGWDEYDTFRVPHKTTRNLSKKQWQDYIIQYRIKARELFDYEMPNFGWDDFTDEEINR